MEHERIQRLQRPQTQEEFTRQFARDVEDGLAASPKRSSSLYFYDQKGSELFKQITQLPEYYLTRCEQEILDANGQGLAEMMLGDGASHVRLVELGAGDSRKPFPIIEAMLPRQSELEFMAVDISESALQDLSGNMERRFPDLRFKGLVAEYFEALDFIKGGAQARNCLLFLGSNIGNFTKNRKIDFLRRIKNRLNPGDLLLIGFDLKKPLPLLQAAYDDTAGVTRAFNLNLLERMNRELGAAFDLDHFSHRAHYNPERGAMESFLVSEREQRVTIDYLERSYHFAAGEALHTEYSHKYDMADIQALADVAGFSIRTHFYDAKRYFVCSLWMA